MKTGNTEHVEAIAFHDWLMAAKPGARIVYATSKSMAADCDPLVTSGAALIVLRDQVQKAARERVVSLHLLAIGKPGETVEHREFDYIAVRSRRPVIERMPAPLQAAE